MMKLLTLIGLFVFGLTACSSQPTKSATMPTQVITVSQPGDDAKSCSQLALEIDQLERDVITMVNIKQQRQKQTFAITSLVDTALAIISQGRSGAAAHLDRSTLKGFNEPEQKRMISLVARHDHLLDIAKQKQCTFVPTVERLLNKVTTQNTPSLRTNFRSRITE